MEQMTSKLRNSFSRQKNASSQLRAEQSSENFPVIENPLRSSHHTQNESAHITNRRINIGSSSSHRSVEEPVREGPDKYGLYTLYDGLLDRTRNPDERDFPVDIVAVHGLNGDSHKTWSASVGKKHTVNWLRDFLPEEFPGSRIFTFGYPAEIFFSLDTGDLDTAARTLLNWLTIVRSQRHEQRPIILMGHSMGGIVVKNALILCVKEANNYGSLKPYVKSLFFFATPHGGSSQAERGVFASTLAKFALPGVKAVRNDYLMILQRESSTLANIAETFNHQSEEYVVYTFVEQAKMHHAVIVTEESAKLGWPHENVFYMSGRDHRNIIQFSSRDMSYETVLGQLKVAVNESLSIYIGQIRVEDESCLQSFSFPQMLSRLSDVESASKSSGTNRSWIIGNMTYQYWLTSSQSLLWLKGNPGTGKSTLMASIQHEIETHQRGKSKCISFFFDRNGATLQRTQLGMFRSLLQQLYRRSIVARSMILKVFEEKKKSFGECGKDWDWQLAELEALFSEVLQAACQEMEFVVLIDALDEASEDEVGREKAAQRISTYFSLLNHQIKIGWGRVKICVSCRHYPNLEINEALEIVVEMENKDALRSFVTCEFEAHVNGWKVQPEVRRNSLVEMVVQKADRQFLWASIRVPMVIQCLNDGTHSFSDVYKVLEEESSKLSDLYQNVLTSNVAGRLRLTSAIILRWIVLAQRPLSIPELRCALQCEESLMDHSVDFGPDVQEDERIEKLVRSSSGGLAVTSRYGPGNDNTAVRFVHQTIYEFLKGRGLSLLGSESKIPVEGVPSIGSMALCEERLSAACLRYWTSEKIVTAIQLWERGDEKMYPFIQYGILNWAVHAARSEQHGRPQISMTEFFKDKGACLLGFSKMIGSIDDRNAPVKRHRYLQLTVSEDLLHIASAFNLASVVEQLLQEGVSVNKDFGNTTPLHYAAERGHAKLTELLLKAGANIVAKINSGETALEIAAARSHTDVVKVLLNHGANANNQSAYGSVFEKAAATGNITLLKMLIDNGADIDIVGGNGGTALEAAVTNHDFETVLFLVEHGAKVNVRGVLVGTPLQIICRWLIDQKDEEMVRYLFSKGANVNAKPGVYGSALTAAAAGPGSIKIIRLLLAKGADVNIRGGECGSALQAACERGDSEIAELLLDNGADLNLTGGYHGSALHAAAANRHGDTLFQTLLARGADIHIRSAQWGSVLQAAVFSGSLTVVNNILNIGGLTDDSGGVYGNALHAAICGENGAGMVKVILDHGADPNSIGAMFCSPLEAAISKGRVEIFYMLLKRGANIDEYGIPLGKRCPFHNENYPTYLQIAVLKGQEDIVQTLLALGADINAKGVKRGNVLSAAVLSGREEMVRLLFENHVKYDHASIEYCLGVARGRKQMTKLLQEQLEKSNKDPREDTVAMQDQASQTK